MKLDRILILAAVSVAATSHGQLINASFEEPPQANGVYTTAPVPGWSASSGSVGVWNIPTAGFFQAEAPHGTQIGYSNANFFAQQSSGILVEGVNEISVQAGRRSDSFAGSFDFQLWAGGTLVDGTLVGGEMLSSAAFNHTSINAGTFTLLSTSFDAAANDPRLGQLLTVRFSRTTGSQMNFDDVRMTSPVPEPATFAVMGVAAMLLRRRKRS